MHRVKHSFLLFPANLVFYRFPAEPSRSPLQGPQARPEAQSHGGPEEQAAASWGGLRERERPRSGTWSGPEQDVHIRGSSSSAHGHKLSRGNKYVNRKRDGNAFHQSSSPLSFHPLPPPHLPYLFSPAPLGYTLRFHLLHTLSSTFSPSYLLCSFCAMILSNFNQRYPDQNLVLCPCGSDGWIVGPKAMGLWDDLQQEKLYK